MRSSISASAAPTSDAEADRLLLVEGPTDVGFFEGLLASNQRSKVRVLSLGGESGLADKLLARIQSPAYEGLRWLGIVLDGDSDPSAQFQSARSAITSFETLRFEVPRQPWQRSQSTPESGSVSIAIFPDGTATGDIERYIWDRILGHHPAATCIEGMIACLHTHGIDKQDDWKARCNSFLHALRPSNEKATMKPSSNGLQLFLHTLPDSHKGILALIPTDDEEV